MKIAERFVKVSGFQELFGSLSSDGKVDRNTLAVVLIMFSSGELEDRLRALFSLIAKAPSQQGRRRKQGKM